VDVRVATRSRSKPSMGGDSSGPATRYCAAG
jgi:hypothetical protein